MREAPGPTTARTDALVALGLLVAAQIEIWAFWVPDEQGPRALAAARGDADGDSARMAAAGTARRDGHGRRDLRRVGADRRPGRVADAVRDAVGGRLHGGRAEPRDAIRTGRRGARIRCDLDRDRDREQRVRQLRVHRRLRGGRLVRRTRHAHSAIARRPPAGADGGARTRARHQGQAGRGRGTRPHRARAARRGRAQRRRHRHPGAGRASGRGRRRRHGARRCADDRDHRPAGADRHAAAARPAAQ